MNHFKPKCLIIETEKRKSKTNLRIGALVGEVSATVNRLLIFTLSTADSCRQRWLLLSMGSMMEKVPVLWRKGCRVG